MCKVELTLSVLVLFTLNIIQIQTLCEKSTFTLLKMKYDPRPLDIVYTTVLVSPQPPVLHVEKNDGYFEIHIVPQ